MTRAQSKELGVKNIEDTKKMVQCLTYPTSNSKLDELREDPLSKQQTDLSEADLRDDKMAPTKLPPPQYSVESSRGNTCSKF